MPVKYFIDQEFIEGFKKPNFGLWGRPRHFIDLISIGIVCEDGREYYAISNEFDPEDANEWVKENVLYKIMLDNGYCKSTSNQHNCLSYNKHAVRYIQKRVGKSHKQIAKEILEFIFRRDITRGRSFTPAVAALHLADDKEKSPEFYGYFADYDWVLFCSLFGTMMDLPDNFPMYCIDLKQMLDEKAKKYIQNFHSYDHPVSHTQFSKLLKEIVSSSSYPQQVNEHSGNI